MFSCGIKCGICIICTKRRSYYVLLFLHENLKTQGSSRVSDLLNDDDVGSGDSRVIDQAWRGAEAYHYYILAQRQLYDGYVDSAMCTGIHYFDRIID